MLRYGNVFAQSNSLKRRNEKNYADQGFYSSGITLLVLNELSAGKTVRKRHMDDILGLIPKELLSKIKEEKVHGSRWNMKYFPFEVVREIFTIAHARGYIQDCGEEEVHEKLDKRASEIAFL